MNIDNVLMLKLHYFIFLGNRDYVSITKDLMGTSCTWVQAFHTLNHKLLLAKLHAYDFGKQALYIIQSYLFSQKQRVNITYLFSY